MHLPLPVICGGFNFPSSRHGLRETGGKDGMMVQSTVQRFKSHICNLSLGDRPALNQDQSHLPAHLGFACQGLGHPLASRVKHEVLYLPFKPSGPAPPISPVVFPSPPKKPPPMRGLETLNTSFLMLPHQRPSRPPSRFMSSSCPLRPRPHSLPVNLSPRLPPFLPWPCTPLCPQLRLVLKLLPFMFPTPANLGALDRHKQDGHTIHH